jgi:hypothetical protein
VEYERMLVHRRMTWTKLVNARRNQLNLKVKENALATWMEINTINRA